MPGDERQRPIDDWDNSSRVNFNRYTSTQNHMRLAQQIGKCQVWLAWLWHSTAYKRKSFALKSEHGKRPSCLEMSPVCHNVRKVYIGMAAPPTILTPYTTFHIVAALRVVHCSLKTTNRSGAHSGMTSSGIPKHRVPKANDCASLQCVRAAITFSTTHSLVF